MRPPLPNWLISLLVAWATITGKLPYGFSHTNLFAPPRKKKPSLFSRIWKFFRGR
uniref:ATPase subunit 8 n=1 Tax=Aulostomus chinensis TaxID=150448 RepID=A7E1M0_AULCH|nr:ATP synthase F0 subunit 8 [Aulostomus chinensis]WNH21701.1 ATP synthase F0 subunit 8 [Aulostomus maculatus]BAF74914.1 ATPase subunit 8 [Aulostomus chinensis]BBU25698.1 ATPase subunit 8 [Aulostomus chinensis]